MKLLAKTNQYYLLFLLFLSPFMIAVDYYLIQYIVNSEINETLTRERERINFYLDKDEKIPQSNYLLSSISIENTSLDLDRLTDTLIYEAHVQRSIPYRKYEFTALLNNQNLKISLGHVLIETNQLIVWLFATTALILLLMAMGLYLINQRISKWAWKPFFKNLERLKNYDITKKVPVQLEPSGISEFEVHNEVVTALMNQVAKDFQTLKEFNENISHEMQTPLAIIRNKMVLLLDDKILNEKELKWVQGAYQEVNKLSKIGKSLTLISRIENQEFTKQEQVDIQCIVEEILDNMKEIISFKDLHLTTAFTPATVKCDPVLINILFTNLIKNAVQHNKDGGYIKMSLTQEKFEIENTGDILKTDTVELFKRFRKNNSATASLGLGLAINIKICEMYGFNLNYHHQNGKHTFSLFFYR